MHFNDFGDPLTSPLGPPAGGHVLVFNEIFQQLFNGLPLNLARTFMFPLRTKLNTFVVPLTFHLVLLPNTYKTKSSQ